MTKYLSLIILACLIAIAFLAVTFTGKHDSMPEEIAEQVVKAIYDIEIDVTPDSKED